MSVLRLLHSSKDPYGPKSGSSSSSKSANSPSLVLDIPTYGAVFMNRPDDTALTNPDGEPRPREDVVIHGELVITMPPSLGRRRVKAIRVGIRSILKLDLKPGRMNEEDILFERSVDVLENNSCQCWLESGTTIFDFTIILPANHPPHDRHSNGTLRHWLYAEIIGQPKPSGGGGLLSFRGRSTDPSRTKSPSGRRTPKSPARSRSNSPAPSPPLDTALLSQAAALSLNGDIRANAPAYDEATTPPPLPSTSPTPAEDWLKGSYKTERNLMLVYNPSAEGDVTVLDLSFNGMAEELGIWSLKLDSNPWTVCALLRCRFNMTSISPRATIYCIRVSLVQTHSITSPRDGPDAEPVVSSKSFLIAEHGRRPPSDNPFPRREFPAIWRGTEQGVGGNDTGDLDADIKGRLPNDDTGRPSTVPGVNTPIKVSHVLQTEVFFAVYGQDPRGQPLRHLGPGGLRVLKINRPVMVPSCIWVHQFVDLPSYEESSKTAFSNQQINVPCSVCGTRPSDRVCTTCPPGLAPHPRHDHDPNVVGDPSGRCRMCSLGFFPAGAGQQNCACGMSIEQMEDRMQRSIEEELISTGRSEMIRSDKEDIERGRTRRMDSA